MTGTNNSNQVNLAAKNADQAFWDNEALPSSRRAEWLADIALWIFGNRELFEKAIVSEGVKTITEAKREVARAIRVFELSSQEATRIEGAVIDFGQEARSAGRKGWVHFRPKGVVLGITPFNDPLNLVAHKVGPAIAAGNAVIIKPHPLTPASAELLREAFHCCGVPGGLFQVCPGGSAVGSELVRHPTISMVSFTGGAEVGKAIAREAAGKAIALELGGVAVTIVAKDADLDIAIPSLVSGMFAAAGQNCLHVQRILVAREIFDDVSKRLVAETASLRLGDRWQDSTQMGRLINTESIARCEAWVHEAVEGGASILVGGKPTPEGYMPTILLGVPPKARLRNQEVFGPVTSLEVFDCLDEAIGSAALSGPALAAAVFTRSLDVPFKLQCLKVGQIVVNDSTDFRIDAMPFGGPGKAGIGREGIRYAIQNMMDPQVMCFHLE